MTDTICATTMTGDRYDIRTDLGVFLSGGSIVVNGANLTFIPNGSEPFYGTLSNGMLSIPDLPFSL